MCSTRPARRSSARGHRGRHRPYRDREQCARRAPAAAGRAKDDWHTASIGIVARASAREVPQAMLSWSASVQRRQRRARAPAARSQEFPNLGHAVPSSTSPTRICCWQRRRPAPHGRLGPVDCGRTRFPGCSAFLLPCALRSLETEIAAAEDALEIDALVTTRRLRPGLYGEDFQPHGPIRPEQ